MKITTPTTSLRLVSARSPRGFTLVEILVVIGIIVILAAVLVPMIGRAMRQAKQTRTAADLQSIATALEAFKADHGDYPRTMPVTGAPLIANSGAAILGRYLNGPLGDGFTSGASPVADTEDPPAYVSGMEYVAGDAVQNGGNRYIALKATTAAPGVATPPIWLDCGTHTGWAHDFVDGPGIRIAAGRKKYGPYISAEKMKMRGLAFVDGNGNQILYFPASRAKLNVMETPGSYVNRVSNPNPAIPLSAGNTSKTTVMYDVDDNFEAFRREGETTADDPKILSRMRAMLGDHDGDGLIETVAGEKVVTEAPYLLWAAGTDGRFGPDPEAKADPTVLDIKDADACDDVTNFRQ